MKSLKIVLASLLLAAGLITFSSYVADSYDSAAFANVKYRYIGPKPATAATIAVTANWQVTTADPNTICPSLSQPCVIEFDNAKLTLAQALALLNAFGFQNLTSDPQTIADPSDPTKTVTVYQIQL